MEILQQQQRPFDVEAEKCVLGSVLRDPQCATEVAAKLLQADFYLPRHRALFGLFERLDASRPGSCDPVTVGHEIDRTGQTEALGGRAYLEDLMFSVPSLAFLENHLEIVRDLAIRRSLLEAAERIEKEVQQGTEDVRALLDRAEQEVFAVGDRLVEGQMVSTKDLVKANLERILAADGPPAGLQTGFIDLDERQGFRPGDLVVLAARPSMGKTALALNIIERVALEFEQPVLLFSLEMPADQIVMRMMSAHSKVRHDGLRTGRLDQTDQKRLIYSADQLGRAPIYIDHSSQPTLAEIRAKARRLKREGGLSLIVIDYLQLLTVPRAESRQHEISIISRSLKALARDLKLPVLALAQLNRKAEDRADHRPMLSDLRESGAIEQDADLVMMLYREEYYSKESERAGLADVIVAKNRNGSTGDIQLRFTKELMRFENFVRDSGL
ncbi:MAG: replicative DNA helicase [Planctomycetes bacterium]|nr:replicative DNA helicase [Planctomycetota bacterium]MBL7007634.1 replicative DNA helicase [Planctomycetota bacterium]